MSEARAGNLGEYPLQGKVAVITGGSNGIGAAAARRLAAAGARIVVGYNQGAERAAALVAALPGEGHSALRTPMEDSAALRDAAAAVQATYGRCDVLINSAATTRPVPHADLKALDDALIDRVLVTNVRGPFATIRAFAPMLKASGDAVIVNISSLAAITGSGSSVIYGASKAAIDTMGMSLARALGPEIRVVSISPSMVATDFVPGRGREVVEKAAAKTPLKTVTEADDVALAVMAAITHLRLTTGSVILVDGGNHL
ncbi:SDR family NAD(P)-dependent oxidoreductase [Siccirubricoccus phaeus]|uniref:SDR family NAD(P)-dependent oxidoreductase n=1 Tax=Siccirubricoccus phaeus TaxID=2595053 RepID=UPI0011F38CD3|nr:SDR family oxidoreductase [Siccirubricoccus phaeus]